MKPVYQTEHRERRYTVMKPVYQTVNQERRYTVYKPVMKTEHLERRYTVQRPVYQTVNQERRYTVMKAVYQTEQRERRYTVIEAGVPDVDPRAALHRHASRSTRRRWSISRTRSAGRSRPAARRSRSAAITSGSTPRFPGRSSKRRSACRSKTPLRFGRALQLLSPARR